MLIDGVPAVKSYGFSGEYNILVMELLDRSLEELFQSQLKKFSVKTVAMIGMQMLDRIEFVHSKNIIHRDIKPDNFVIGSEQKSHIIYILDFGLSKKYRSNRTHQHIKFNVNKKLTGTARYASINALKGCEQSRRDDLEAIGYVLLYFLRGSLPWQGLKVNKNEERYKRIYLKKMATTAEDLCKDFPKEFTDYVNYTRNLEFEADPDYAYLRGLLYSVLNKSKTTYDFYFDWCSNAPVIKDQIAIEKYVKNNFDSSLIEKMNTKVNENESMDLNDVSLKGKVLSTISDSDAQEKKDYYKAHMDTNMAENGAPVENGSDKGNSAGVKSGEKKAKNNAAEKKKEKEKEKKKEKENSGKGGKKGKKEGKKEICFSHKIFHTVKSVLNRFIITIFIYIIVIIIICIRIVSVCH